MDGLDIILDAPNGTIIDEFSTKASLTSKIPQSDLSFPTSSSVRITTFFTNSQPVLASTLDKIVTLYFIGEPFSNISWSNTQFEIFLTSSTICHATNLNFSTNFSFAPNIIKGHVTIPNLCSGTQNQGLDKTTIDISQAFSSTLPYPSCNTLTNIQGYYSCPLLYECVYFVTPSKANPVSCGVDMVDYGLLYSHLFFPPNGCIGGGADYWRLYAADVDRNFTLDNTDLSIISSIASSNLAMQGPWNQYYFIPASAIPVLAGENLPCAVNLMSFNPFDWVFLPESPEYTSDFFAVKPGDINASCTNCNTLVSGTLSNRSSEVDNHTQIVQGNYYSLSKNHSIISIELLPNIDKKIVALSLHTDKNVLNINKIKLVGSSEKDNLEYHFDKANSELNIIYTYFNSDANTRNIELILELNLEPNQEINPLDLLSQNDKESFNKYLDSKLEWKHFQFKLNQEFEYNNNLNLKILNINPNNIEVLINGNYSKNSTLIFIDQMGKIISKTNVLINNEFINIDRTLIPGIYFLSLNDGKNIISKSIMVN